MAAYRVQGLQKVDRVDAASGKHATTYGLVQNAISESQGKSGRFLMPPLAKSLCATLTFSVATRVSVELTAGYPISLGQRYVAEGVTAFIQGAFLFLLFHAMAAETRAKLRQNSRWDSSLRPWWLGTLGCLGAAAVVSLFLLRDIAGPVSVENPYYIPVKSVLIETSPFRKAWIFSHYFFLLAMSIAILTPVFEEYLFAYVYETLRTRHSAMFCTAVSGVLFAAIHHGLRWEPVDWSKALFFFLWRAGATAIYVRTQSLPAVTLIHCAWNGTFLILCTVPFL
jgi:membrane protease YdiL (CAAX protease family)